MNSRQQKYVAVIEALLAGRTVVTANRHLAREVLLQFADYNREQKSVWERPSVLPWPDWLQQLWQKLVWGGPQPSDLRLLGQGQFQLLWEQIIFKTEGDSLMQTGAAARQAARAYELAHEWRLPWSQARELASEDAARFLDWADVYRKACQNAGWIDRAQVADLIAGHFDAAGQSLVPEPVMLAGFDELTPQQQFLIDALERSGTQVARWLPTHTGHKVCKRRVVDAETELTAAASWCLESLRADPACSLGVVVPDLSDRYEEVTRVFADVLAPGACESLAETEKNIFSVSAGPPLARHPMVADALGILEMADAEPAWAHASHMLRSQFLGDALLEADQRAAMDAMLREAGSTCWPLAYISRQARIAIAEQSDSACPALGARIENALKLRESWPLRQDTHGWVQAISAWLEAFGWPGDRALNSSEFQILARWRELLEEIAAYESLLGSTSIGPVLNLVRRLSNEARFKPESGRCAVQVLGVLEAAGLEFDKLWVCGLHDGVWPPAPAPTPFLAYGLQRSQGMPHSSSARELEMAALQLKRLVASADEVLLSWPATEGDQELRPSPLIEAFQDAAQDAEEDKAVSQRAAELFRARPELERTADADAPVLASSEAARGGARVLELQAWCPFRAFAELRLLARPLKQPAPGLDAINRGSIVHDSLYELWRVLGDQATLAALDLRARGELVRRSISKAMRSVKADGDPLMKHLLKLETRRLQRLIGELLSQELDRPPFKVEMLEQRKTAAVGPLSLHTRLDRLDVLSDGGRLVIDYKSGAASPGHWFGIRPRAPQLPLYASGLGLQDVRGLAFVKVRSAAVQFAGVCDVADEMPAGVKPPTRAQWSQQGVSDWPALLVDWRTRLSRLATAFQQGQSRVEPLSDACRNCHLHGLCRVDEKRDLGELAEDV